MNILLAGYYGCGNIGDDAMWLALTQQFEPSAVKWTVASGVPGKTHRLFGVDAIPRKDMGEIKTAIQQSDALVFAGGSIFQDATSQRSVLYYSQLVSMAKKAGKKVILLSQGVGPLTQFFSKRWARSAFEAADLITVRDADSLRALKELGVTKQAFASSDLAWLLPMPKAEDTGMGFSVGTMKSVGVAPRVPVKGDMKVWTKFYAELMQQLFRMQVMPVLIEMDEGADDALINAVDKLLDTKSPHISKLDSPLVLQQRLRRMDAVLAVRLHAGILAAGCEVPVAFLSYDPKVTSAAKNLQAPMLPLSENLKPDRAAALVADLLKNRDQTLRNQQERVRLQRAEAIKSVELMAKQLRLPLLNQSSVA
ncbi:MAG: polysaccharide pyruvyl transferase CsaB [Fimbriimonadaceae bacterium]